MVPSDRYVSAPLTAEITRWLQQSEPSIAWPRAPVVTVTALPPATSLTVMARSATSAAEGAGSVIVTGPPLVSTRYVDPAAAVRLPVTKKDLVVAA